MKYKNFFKILLIILSSFVIFFILGEFLIRIYLINHTIYDVEMAKYATTIKTDSKNPLIQHVHKPNSNARLMNVMVHINSDGFRDKEYPIAKDGKYRIIFLGDSLTLGWGVEYKDTFKYILEEKMDRLYPTEIINFGTGNYNTEQEVNLFIEKGLKYKPDKVVVFYFINDAEITPKKSKLWFLGYSHMATFYWSRIHTFLNNIFPSKDFRGYYSNLYDKNHEGWARTQKAFLQLRDICRKDKIALQVILLPEFHNLEDYLFKREHAAISEFLQRNGISNLDLAPYFTNIKEPMRLWVAYDDAHPNKLAHQLIAEYSLDFVAKK